LFLDDPGSKFLYGKLGKEGRKRSKEGKKRKGIQTAELDRRDQMTATVPGPVPVEREQRSITR